MFDSQQCMDERHGHGLDVVCSCQLRDVTGEHPIVTPWKPPALDVLRKLPSVSPFKLIQSSWPSLYQNEYSCRQHRF